MKTINIYEKLIKNNYLLLDSGHIEIESMQKLTKTFQGYNKVIATLLMRYLQLPSWPTLLIKDHKDPEVQKAIVEFSKRSKTFFVRTDTQFSAIDNLAFRNCLAEDLISNIDRAKEYDKRWVLVLAQPNVSGQEYLNDANFRMGVINGQLTIEWTGPGFAEYHLGKDKFPHQSALHAVQIIDREEKPTKIFQADRTAIEKDLTNLLTAYGLERNKLKKSLLDKSYFYSLTGYEFIKKEPTNDEFLLAYDKWLEKESKLRSCTIEAIKNSLVEEGKLHLANHCKAPAYTNLLNRKYCWYPHHKQVIKVMGYYKNFIRQMKKLNLDVEEKILTGSLNKYANKEGIIFWDVFNLVKES